MPRPLRRALRCPHRTLVDGVETPAVLGLRRQHDDLAAPTSRFVRAAFGDVLAEATVDVGFQPIVELQTCGVVGYEALSRGPRGTELEHPDELFAAARGAGRLDELDWLCQRRALRSALDAGLHAPSMLFLNIEPEATGFMPLDLRSLYAEATAQMTVAVEVTERALTERPAALLGHVADMRALGCVIAIDDVGAEPGSLAMMAVLAPEVIKLDLALIEAADSRQLAELIAAVTAQAERTGATILVERVETPRQAELAEALGARLAQGFLYGRRGRLTMPPPAHVDPDVRATERPDPRDTTPFALVAERRVVRQATRRMLSSMSRHLEEQALRAGHGAVLLSSFERGERFGKALRARYARLARQVAFCGAVGERMRMEPAPGVRGGALTAGDPLTQEWSVAVVSPHFAAALTAHDLRDGVGDDALYDFVLTHDRGLAVASAASLMARIGG